MALSKGIALDRPAGWDFPGGSVSKASVYNLGELGSIPGSGRSPGEGNGNPLQYYCLENPMDRRSSLIGYSPWGTKSRIRLSGFTSLLGGGVLSREGGAWLKLSRQCFHLACGTWYLGESLRFRAKEMAVVFPPSSAFDPS